MRVVFPIIPHKPLLGYFPKIMRIECKMTAMQLRVSMQHLAVEYSSGGSSSNVTGNRKALWLLLLNVQLLITTNNLRSNQNELIITRK